MTETWVPVLEDPRYAVSSLGRVRGPKGAVLIGRPNGQGYLRICLGANRDRYVHRLVCRAFHGEPPSASWHADHKNKKRDDNRQRNLQWSSPGANRATRQFARGERSGCAKLTAAAVREIRACSAGKIQDVAFAAKFKVSRETVRDVRLHKLWRHIQ